MTNNVNEKNYINVYFIESHLKGVELELYLKEEEKQFYDSLKCAEKFDFKYQENALYEISIYSFKVYKAYLNEIKPKQKKFVKIILDTFSKNKFETKIYAIEFDANRNCFIFNIKFESCKRLLGIDLNSTPKSLFLEDDQIFDIYLKFLANIPQEERNKNHDDLIYYSMNYFERKKENMTYYFFADIFVECYSSEDHRRRLLNLYKKDKFDLSDIENPRNKLDNIRNAIKNVIKNIKPILNDENDNNQKKLIYFLFYFNYYYQKEVINKMIEIERIKPYVYDILIKEKFNDLKLNKNSIKNLIKSSNNFEGLNIILTYNNSFLELLEAINEDNEENKFLQRASSNSHKGAKNKNNNKYIKIKDFIDYRESDNLEEIFQQIKKLIKYEKEEKIFFVYFNDNIFDSYLKMHKEDLNKLILTYKIAKYIGENNEFSKLQKIDAFLKYIHEKGYEIINQCKSTNEDILNYIENDDYFNDCNNNDYQNQFFKVIQYFDLSKMNSEFINKWKKIDWPKKYGQQKDKFYKNLCGTLKDIQYFGILLNLCEENKDYDEEFITNILSIMETMSPTFDLKKCPDFIEQITELIYLCKIKDIDPIPFINNFLLKSDNLSMKVFENLILKNKNNLTKEVKKVILDFYNKNIMKLGKINISVLLYIINKSQKLDDEIISYLNNYSMSKEDYFTINETDCLKIYKALYINNFLKDEKVSSSDYYMSIISLNYKLNKELDKGDIEYYLINDFYSHKKQDILDERLLLLSNSDFQKSFAIKTKLENYMNKTNVIMNKLNKIYNYFTLFYPKSQKDKIEIIGNLKNLISKNNLLYYTTIEEELKILEDIKNSKFEKEIEENSELEQDEMFLKIYNNFKEINDGEENEEKNLIDSKKYIEMMKTIIDENSINSSKINIKDLQDIILTYKKEQSNIINDIQLMKSAYKIQNEVNINKISEDLFFLSKKEKYIKSIEALTKLVDLTEGKKTYLSSVLKIIITKLRNLNDIEIIRFSGDVLKNYNIDINSEFMEILIELLNKEEETKFLFNTKNSLSIIQNIDKSKDKKDIITDIQNCILIFSKFMNSIHEKQMNDFDIISYFKNFISENIVFSCFLSKYYEKFNEFKNIYLGQK